MLTGELWKIGGRAVAVGAVACRTASRLFFAGFRIPGIHRRGEAEQRDG
jgi:hypothetical protein